MHSHKKCCKRTVIYALTAPEMTILRDESYKVIQLLSIIGKTTRILVIIKQLEFRLIFLELTREATGVIFVIMWMIPLYRPFYEKLV